MFRFVGRRLASAASSPPAGRFHSFRTLPEGAVDDVYAQVLERSARGAGKEALQGAMLTASVGCGIVTYSIMLNWVYQGYLDLWEGTYGADDDDDDD